MITRKNRFHGYGALKYVHQHAKIARGQLASLKYMRNDRRSGYRAAVVVSKKVNKSAVVRNRIRRRIYETIRQNISPNEPYDLIISVYSDQLASCTDKELQQEIISKLRAAHIPTLQNSDISHGIVKSKEKT